MANRSAVLSNLTKKVAVSPTSFLKTLEDWSTSPASQYMWLVTFNDMSDPFSGVSTSHFPKSVTGDIVRNLEFTDSDKDSDWNLGLAANFFNSDTDAVNRTDLAACMLIQGVNIPGEAVGHQYKSVESRGGILPIMYGDERFEPQEMTTAIYESNTSFIDTVIRPWVILSSHHGQVVRDAPERNVKCTITISQLAKTIPRELTSDIVGEAVPNLNQGLNAFGRPNVGVAGSNRGSLSTGINSSSESGVVVRKQFVFFNAVPIRMESSDLTYNSDGGAQVKNVSWAYTHYVVRDYNSAIKPTLNDFYQSELQMSKREAALEIWNEKFTLLESKYPLDSVNPYAIPKSSGDGISPVYSKIAPGTMGAAPGVTLKELKEKYQKNKLRHMANAGIGQTAGSRGLRLYGPKGEGYSLSFNTPGATFEERWKVIKTKNLCIDPRNPTKNLCVPDGPPPGSALDKIRSSLRNIRKLARNARGLAAAFKQVGKAKGVRGKLGALGDLNKSFKKMGGGSGTGPAKRNDGTTLGGGMPKAKSNGKTSSGIGSAISVVDDAKKAARAITGKSRAKGGF